MRGLLLWALVIILGQTILRLLCWSLLIFIPLGVVEAWRQDSELKLITTALSIAVGLLLLVRRRQLSRPVVARVSWLLVAVLTSISVVVVGTTGTVGYTILKQPTSRLADLVTVGAFVAAGLTYSRLIERRKKVERALVVFASCAGALVFLPGLFWSIPFEEQLAGGFLRPTSIAVEFLLPLALAVGVLLSHHSANDGAYALVREKWFEFSVIVSATVMGLTTMARVYI
jgi:hypothetical protein